MCPAQMSFEVRIKISVGADFAHLYIILNLIVLKVSEIQNEFIRSSLLPKCKPKITRISALPNKQGSKAKNLPTITKKSPKKYYDPCFFGRAEILVIFGLHFERHDDLMNSF